MHILYEMQGFIKRGGGYPLSLVEVTPKLKFSPS